MVHIDRSEFLDPNLVSFIRLIELCGFNELNNWEQIDWLGWLSGMIDGID